MRLWLSPRASQDMERAIVWWRTNRDAAPGLLEEEIQEAKRRLLAAPHGGVRVPGEGDTRRVLLPRTRYWLFYEVDEAQQRVRILRMWHVSRGQSPRFRSR